MPDGDGFRVVVTIEDITWNKGERKHDIIEADSDFERFFNLIPDLACIVSTDGYFKKVNPAWETTLGYTREEVSDADAQVHSSGRPGTDVE